MADAKKSSPLGPRDIDSAVWAINCDTLKFVEVDQHKSAKLEPNGQEDRYSMLLSDIAHWPPIVAAIEPVRMHERLTAQQGLFLAPSSLSYPFKDCLISTIERANALRTPEARVLKKLVLKAGARLDAIEELARMNITWATLMPGLDGFGASLCTTAETFGRTDSLGPRFDDGAHQFLAGEAHNHAGQPAPTPTTVARPQRLRNEASVQNSS